MNLRDLGKSLKDEKKVLRNGGLLLLLAAVLVIFIIQLDVVGDFFVLLFNAISPLLAGIVMAYVLNVFVVFFEKVAFRPLQKRNNKVWNKVSRPLSIFLAYMVAALLILLIVCFIVPGLLKSLTAVADTARLVLPEYANSIVKWLNEFAQRYDLTFIQDFLRSFNWGGLIGDVTKLTSDFLSSLFNVTVNVFSGVFSTVMALIISIYLLSGKGNLLRALKGSMFAFLPKPVAKKVIKISSLANQVYFSFIKGQLLECVILGVLCYIGMSLLGLDYALLISSVVAIGALIPILGAYIGAGVGVVVLLLVNPLDSLIFLIFLLCLQQIEGNLIYPRVVGSSIGLPAVWTLFAVLFWGGVLGIPGILIGTPTTAVVYKLFRASVQKRLKARQVTAAEVVALGEGETLLQQAEEPLPEIVEKTEK